MKFMKKRQEQREQLIEAIKVVHQHSMVEPQIKEELIKAVKGLKANDNPPYVAHNLSIALSHYFVTHPTNKDIHLHQLYEITNQLSHSYRRWI